MAAGRFRWVVMAALGVLPFLGGCATRTVEVPAAPGAVGEELDVAPALTVERFLKAVNADDWESMGRIFGTMDGPVADRTPRKEVELRMNAIALILKHDDFTIATQRRVPGRDRATVRLGVDLTVGERTVPDVAFVVVQSRGGPWLVEEIDLVKVTSS